MLGKFLSPSSINSYFQCPLRFYYTYIDKLPQTPSIHLYKGTFVHSAIEKFFESTTYQDPETFFLTYVNYWEPDEGIVLTEEEGKKHYEEMVEILTTFSGVVKRKLFMLQLEDKVKHKNQAWNLVRPKSRELELKDDKLRVRGFIDAIQETYDGNTFIIDYKTSKLYKGTVSQDYIRQLYIYALLYKKQMKRSATFVGINYLRYGETFNFPVTDLMLKRAEATIKHVHKKTDSTNIKDYKGCNKGWCEACKHYRNKK